MNKRMMQGVLIAGLVLICGMAFAADRPNVLFIISDDLNNDLGTYDHPLVQSPNIDRLAQRGVQFDRAYCQMPLCNPSRVSMLTSLYPEQTGIYGNKVPIRDRFKNIVTLPELFRKNGYFTARVGKIFHYGVPGDIGTDGLDDPQSWDEVFNPIGRDKTEEKKIFSLIPGSFGGTLSWLSMDSTDDEQTDGQGALATIRMLEEHAKREGDEPFFIAYGLYRPHTPFVAPKKYFDLYPVDEMPIWNGTQMREPKAAFLKAKSEQETMTDLQRREAKQAYFASTSFMDAQVGRVLDALDRLGYAENTIVVFVSDHGYHLGEHGMWQKRSLFENSARVPLIIATPETTPRRTKQLVESIDLYPTLASLCGLKVPGHVMGADLSPILRGEEVAVRAVSMTEENRNDRQDGKPLNYTGQTIRTERYRYTEWDSGNHGVELYDHETDPEEMNNLAGDAEFDDMRAKLSGLLHEKLAVIRAKDLTEWK